MKIEYDYNGNRTWNKVWGSISGTSWRYIEMKNIDVQLEVLTELRDITWHFTHENVNAHIMSILGYPR